VSAVSVTASNITQGEADGTVVGHVTLHLSDVRADSAPQLAEALGLPAIDLDYDSVVRVDSKQRSMTLDRARLSLPGAGAVNLTFKISQIPENLFAESLPLDGRPLVEMLALIAIDDFTLAYEDSGLTRRTIERIAEANGQSIEDYMDTLDLAADFITAGLHGPRSRQADVAVKAFLHDPQRFTLTARPTAPVRLGDLIRALDVTPDSVPDLLNLSYMAD
jgi:hypothetical protein